MIFILIFVFTTFVFAQGEEEFKKATLEYINGNLEDALIYASSAYEKNPKNEDYKKLLSQVYIESASSLIAEGKYATALKYLSQAEELKLSMEKIKDLKAAIQKIEEKKPKEKPVQKKKKIVPRKKVPRKTPPGQPPKKIVVEKVREYQPVVVEKKIHIEGYKILLGLIIFIIVVVVGIVFYVRTLIKHREQEVKLESERALKESERVKKELYKIAEESKKLREELEAEKRRKAQILKAVADEKKQLAEKKTYEKASKALNEAKEEKPSKKTKEKELIPIKTEMLLPEYTDIPTTSEEMGRILKNAPPSERGIIIWGLGNKKDLKAVEILGELFENPLSEAEEMEILKSLKKIYLRPQIDKEVKEKVAEILAKARHKGIII